MFTFFLTGARAGKSCVLGHQYQFVDGKLTVADAAGHIIRPALEKYYEVVSVVHADDVEADVPVAAMSKSDQAIASMLEADAKAKAASEKSKADADVKAVTAIAAADNRVAVK